MKSSSYTHSNDLNFVTLLRKRELGSTACLKAVSYLPKTMLKRLSRENERIPDCVISLSEALASRDIAACSAAVKHASLELADHSGAIEQREGVAPNSPRRDCFLLFGGPQVLVSILQVQFMSITKTASS